MYISPWLQAALLPERWNVAGVRCASLSVWHVFALRAVGNAFVCGIPERMDMDAAAELLLYAGNSHREGVKLYTIPEYRKQETRAVHRILARQKWESVLMECTDYVEACLRVPCHKSAPVDLKTGQSNSRDAAAPLAWILFDHLYDGNPKNYEAAWDTPHAVACCLFDAHRDINGQDSTLESLSEAERYDAKEEARKARAS